MDSSHEEPRALLSAQWKWEIFWLSLKGFGIFLLFEPKLEFVEVFQQSSARELSIKSVQSTRQFFFGGGGVQTDGIRKKDKYLVANGCFLKTHLQIICT
jgi:hypothetical protein